MVRVGSLAAICAAMALVAVGTWWLHARVATSATPPVEPLPVRTASITVADHFVREARYVGRIEAARTTTLAFELPGLVDDIVFDEGARVGEGQVVARQDVRIRTAERHRLVAEREALDAQIALALVTERRQAALEDRGFSATQAYDEARFARAQLEAEAVAVGAAIDRLDVELDKAQLRAPYAGTIGRRYLDEGGIVASGTPVLDILETGRLEARIGLPPSVAAALAVGERVELEFAGRNLAAQVVAKRPDLDGNTRTVPVRLALDPTALPPPTGALVTLALTERVDTAGFWVPTAILETGTKGLFQVPLAVNGDGGWQRAFASVEIIHNETERAFVRGPLPDGAELVLAGAHRVPVGAPLARIVD